MVLIQALDLDGSKGLTGGSPQPGMGLDLTPEQKAKFQEMRRRFMEENAQLIGALIAKSPELRSLWTDPKSDSKAILDKEKELRVLQNQMRDKIIQAMLEVRKTLAPEQISKFSFYWGMGRGWHDGPWPWNGL